MVTYASVRAAEADQLAAIGAQFRHLAARMVHRAEDVTTAWSRLADSWTGETAAAAAHRCRGLAEAWRAASFATLASDQILCELAAAIRQAQAILHDAHAMAAAAGVGIEARGGVVLTGDDVVPSFSRLQGIAPIVRRIEDGVELAAQADAEAAGRLAELLSWLPVDAAAPVSRASTVPAFGTDPRLVRTWWAGLTPSEQEGLLLHRPDAVGRLDGVPVGVRDLANRVRLEAERDHLRRRRKDLLAEAPTRLTRAELSRVDAHLRGLDALVARLADPSRPRAYLLDLAADGDGQAVVAIGDPDHATDVLTFVPGAGSDLSGIGGVVDRAELVAKRAAQLGPDHRVAAIAWLGYDAPDGPAAAGAGAAHDAEGALDRFQDGLRATHEGERSHNTVLGHSYGTLTAGVTARDAGLDADDLVFVGSPGVGVDRVGELRLPAGHVWSSTAANDPVQRFAPGFGQILADTLANLRDPFSFHHYGDARPDVLLWHGRNPSADSFSARVFTSDPDGGHGGYWQGSGLDNLARITLGGRQQQDVR